MTQVLAAIIEEAERVQRQELMPDLAGEDRFKAAMVAKALRLAARQVEQGMALRSARHELLRQAYGDRDAPLGALEQRLAADARGGKAPLKEAHLVALLRRLNAMDLELADADRS